MREIEKTSVFTKDFKKLPVDIQQEVWKVICVLRENVFDKKLDIKKLEGYQNTWRIRIKNFYRLIYTFDKERIYLLRVKQRKDIYR